jgi:hypothetical protein
MTDNWHYNKGAEVAEVAQREYLTKRLALCTERQRELFHQLYDRPSNPSSPDVPTKDLSSAIALVERTISMNEQKAGDDR